jgi:hypothetical protein
MAENLTPALGLENRAMLAVDVGLGAGALAAPARMLRLMGQADPSDDAVSLFRRCGPVWLTFAAAHALIEPAWTRSPASSTPRLRTAIAATAGATLAMSLGYAQLASRRPRHSLSGAVLRIGLRATWREARATAKDGRARVRAVASRG